MIDEIVKRVPDTNLLLGFDFSCRFMSSNLVLALCAKEREERERSRKRARTSVEALVIGDTDDDVQEVSSISSSISSSFSTLSSATLSSTNLSSSSSSSSSSFSSWPLRLRVASISVLEIKSEDRAAVVAGIAQGANAIGVLNLHPHDLESVERRLYELGFKCAAKASMASQNSSSSSSSRSNSVALSCALWIDKNLDGVRVQLDSESSSRTAWQDAVITYGIAGAGAVALFSVNGVGFLLSALGLATRVASKDVMEELARTLSREFGRNKSWNDDIDNPKKLRVQQLLMNIYGIERSVGQFETKLRKGTKTKKGREIVKERGWFVPCIVLASLNAETMDEKKTLLSYLEGACGPKWVNRSNGNSFVFVRSSHVETSKDLYQFAGISQDAMKALGEARIVANAQIQQPWGYSALIELSQSK